MGKRLSNTTLMENINAVQTEESKTMLTIKQAEEWTEAARWCAKRGHLKAERLPLMLNAGVVAEIASRPHEFYSAIKDAEAEQYMAEFRT